LQSLRVKSRIALVVLIFLIVAPSVFALRSLVEGRHNIERSIIAHEVLDTHLLLANSSFKYLNHIRQGGSLDDQEGALYKREVASQLAGIRKLIASEIQLIGEEGFSEEEEELVRLGRIEASLSRALQGTEDRDWIVQINAAVAEERREVSMVDTQAQKTLQSVMALLVVSTLCLTGIAAFVVFWLQRSLLQPATDILDGMSKLGEGKLNYRVVPRGDAEFRALGERFNSMAAQVQASAKSMENDRDALQIMVEERTAELAAANADLSTSAQQRTQFLIDISHELRTPLAIIRGEAEVTLRGADKPLAEYRASLARVADQVKGMGRLVDDLLYIARNETGQAKLKLRPLSLHMLLQRVTHDLRALVEADDGQLIYRSYITASQILGDEDRLRQLMQILLDNAIHYSEGPPDIDVSLRDAAEYVAITVRDNGIGIAPDDLLHIFERYHRGRFASKQNDLGIGIGLPMAKAIAEDHGGSIRVESVEGEGTSVTILLPVSQSARAAV
jgi:two-component system, OmpR family, sensor kinase